ncbi:MAG: hypothetical protein JO091_14940 [Acidobacteriaceae bacterium]|nr:hypothetical protein [Acidobacteriaceae bacterium]
MRLERFSKLGFLAALATGCALAATPSIGIASALGTFSVNDVKVEGNANLFDGSQLKTTSASSHVYLAGGSELTLGVNSAATFYTDHVVLQQGATRVDGMNHLRIQTGAYRIESAAPASEAVVRLTDGAVQVATMTGSIKVFNSRGVLLNQISPGTASSFDMRAGNNTPAANADPQSGAVAGQPPAQSGATAATPEDALKHKHQQEELFTALGVTLGGLGLAVDAILQPAPTSP